MATQEKLLDVPIGEAQRQAEVYAAMEWEIKEKQEKLKAQALRVIDVMRDTEQVVLQFADEFGVRHRFEVVDSDIKLKHTRKGEPDKTEPEE